MPLAMIESGRRVRILAVEAGRGLRSRLSAMGLVQGAEIDVIRNSAHGPVVVAVNGSRVMLGRGMASKIDVK
jgi:Fe2+ transport system protein FeoA